jgi:hypothetical protein
MSGKVVRISIAALLSSASTLPARADPVQVTGKLGYLSEWELSARVTERSSERGKEFSGPITVRHVGVCAPGRPVEMSGEIRYRITGWVKPRITATLSLDGVDCGIEGRLSETYDGVMSCDQWRGVPVSLSIKPGG